MAQALKRIRRRRHVGLPGVQAAAKENIARAERALELLKQATWEGQKGYVASLARIENPYRPGTARYIAWAEGWDAAYNADRRDP